MNKYFNIQVIGSVASIAALLFFIYYQYIFEKNTELQIQEINNTELTKQNLVNNFDVTFNYNGSVVNNLWQSRFSVKNTGSTTIIGKGPKKNIIDSSLVFYVDTSYSILNIETLANSFPIIIDHNSNEFSVDFKQWRKNEFLEFKVFLEGKIGDSKSPVFKLNERDIINCKVQNVTFSVSDNKPENNKLIDIFPPELQSVLWWFTIIFYGIVVLIILYQQITLKKGSLFSRLFSTISILFILLIPLLWMISR